MDDMVPQNHMLRQIDKVIDWSFKDTDLFEQIFSKILEECMKFHLVNTEQIFVDAIHVEACANRKKTRKRIAKKQALCIRHTLGNKEIYALRKETIERIFGTAKEQHFYLNDILQYYK